MTINQIELNPNKNYIKIHGSLGGNENISGISVDNQNTFVCINDPSDVAHKIPKPLNEDGVEDSLLYLNNELDIANSYLDLNKDLLFIFIHLNTYKYYTWNGSTYELYEGSLNGDEVIEDYISGSEGKVGVYYKDTISKTTLYVTYNKKYLASYSWEVLKSIPTSLCCTDFPEKVKDFLIYKEGALTALRNMKFREAIMFWKALFNIRSLTTIKCSCNGY